MLNIYIRKDLNMRKGKMAAQSAHAAMKLLIECMIPHENKLILNKLHESQLLDFLKNPHVNINYVENEAELKNSINNVIPSSIIVDNGRTEFHGVPTATCAASGIFKNSEINEIYVPQTYGTDIKAKQIFVYSKENPLSKENAVKLSTVSCLNIIYKLLTNNKDFKYIDLSVNNELSAWLTGAFGKIAVSVKKDEDLEILKNNLIENNIKVFEYSHENNKCLVIEPKYPENIDVFTKHLSLI